MAERRILFVTRKWPPAVGGMETYARELARELAAHGDLRVLALPGRADGRPPHPLALAAFLARCLWRLALVVRRTDVLILGDLVLHPLAIWARLMGMRGRIVQTVHGTDVVYAQRRGLGPLAYRLYTLALRLRPSPFDAVVANSRATAARARRLGLPEPSVVPLGVRMPDDDPQPASEVPPHLLFVGRATRRKGVAWFARAVLPRLPADTVLKIAGPVLDDAAALRADPRVELLGPVTGARLARLRRDALAVLAPNVPDGPGDFVEGFGLVAAEAAAAGGVVLASDLDGFRDAVVDGVTGFLLPAGDAAAWAAAVKEVRAWSPERRAAFVAASRACVAERFDWARVARETLAAAAVAGPAPQASAAARPAAG